MPARGTPAAAAACKPPPALTHKLPSFACPPSLHCTQTNLRSPCALLQEWDEFILALKKPLPITFRINGQGKFADRLLEKLEANFMQQFTEGPLEVGGAAAGGMHEFWGQRCSRAQGPRGRGGISNVSSNTTNSTATLHAQPPTAPPLPARPCPCRLRGSRLRSRTRWPGTPATWPGR